MMLVFISKKDKDKINLGNNLTIQLAEPNSNMNSRTMYWIPVDVIFMNTDKFGKIPLV